MNKDLINLAVFTLASALEDSMYDADTQALLPEDINCLKQDVSKYIIPMISDTSENALELAIHSLRYAIAVEKAKEERLNKFMDDVGVTSMPRD